MTNKLQSIPWRSSIINQFIAIQYFGEAIFYTKVKPQSIPWRSGTNYFIAIQYFGEAIFYTKVKPKSIPWRSGTNYFIAIQYFGEATFLSTALITIAHKGHYPSVGKVTRYSWSSFSVTSSQKVPQIQTSSPHLTYVYYIVNSETHFSITRRFQKWSIFIMHCLW